MAHYRRSAFWSVVTASRPPIVSRVAAGNADGCIIRRERPFQIYVLHRQRGRKRMGASKAPEGRAHRREGPGRVSKHPDHTLRLRNTFGPATSYPRCSPQRSLSASPLLATGWTSNNLPNVRFAPKEAAVPQLESGRTAYPSSSFPPHCPARCGSHQDRIACGAERTCPIEH